MKFRESCVPAIDQKTQWSSLKNAEGVGLIRAQGWSAMVQLENAEGVR